MDDKIEIILSKDSRDLLLKYESCFMDKALFRLIAIAVKEGKNYKLYFTEEQFDEFLDQLIELSDNEDDGQVRCALDDIYDHFEQYLDTFTGDGYCQHSTNTGPVYFLKVCLVGDEKIWRKIAIREGQTLDDLHNIIFEAFDRYDEHMYSFFFPYTPMKKFDYRKIYKSSVEYTHPYICEDQDMFDGDNKNNAARTTIEALELDEGDKFFYLFDFGDEWWHEITVEKTDGRPSGTYPRVSKRAGKSPKQYDLDEEW